MKKGPFYGEFVGARRQKSEEEVLAPAKDGLEERVSLTPVRALALVLLGTPLSAGGPGDLWVLFFN